MDFVNNSSFLFFSSPFLLNILTCYTTNKTYQFTDIRSKNWLTILTTRKEITTQLLYLRYSGMFKNIQKRNSKEKNWNMTIKTKHAQEQAKEKKGKQRYTHVRVVELREKALFTNWFVICICSSLLSGFLLAFALVFVLEKHKKLHQSIRSTKPVFTGAKYAHWC